MPSSQRYVSNELTHFVGRAKADEEERYTLLLKILKDLWLTHPPHVPGRTLMPEVTFDPDKTIGDDICTVQSVCFCDIPLGDLHIHMQKYGCVGLSFSKAFLVEQGANPVFYVAGNGVIDVIDQAMTAKKFVEYQADIPGWVKKHGRPFEVHQLLPGIMSRMTRGEHLRSTMKTYTGPFTETMRTLHRVGPQHTVAFSALHQAVALDFFSYLKAFDARHDDDHEKNYYMEREWRVVNNVEFKLADVERIILPDRRFGGRLRKDVPDFDGQVTFAE